VRVDAVGAYRKDLGVVGLKLVIVCLECLKVGGADESEVAGVEGEDDPLALIVAELYGLDLVGVREVRPRP